MRNHLLIASIMIFVSSCASNVYKDDSEYLRINSIKMTDLYSAIEISKEKEIYEVLASANSLNDMDVDVEFNERNTNTIKMGGNKYFAEAYDVRESRPSLVSIKSYIISVDKFPDYLLFPLISVFDSNYSLQETVSPEHDYTIYNGALSATYRIPQNTTYLLIHTDKKYLDLGSMDGSNGGILPTSKIGYSDVNAAIAVGAILGGAVGGAMAAALTSTPSIHYYDQAPAENYFFGPGGVVDITIVEGYKQNLQPTAKGSAR
jgi:hypothetical protein